MPDDIDAPQPSTPEPVLLGYVVTTILAALAAFGVDVTEDWVGKLAAGAAGLLVVLFSAYLTRSKVTPVAKAEAAVAEARAEEKAASAPWVAAAESARPSLAEFGGAVAPVEPAKPVNYDSIIKAVDAARRIEPVAPPAPPAPPDNPPDQAKPAAGLAPPPAPEPPVGLTW